MDRGGSRRGQGREAGPDGWQSAPAPRPQKAGDLTTLGKIRSSSGSPALGMLGAKAGQKAAAKEESSMTSNAFALLAGDGEHKEADPTSPPATGPARRPLQLQPRSKPTADDAADTPAEEEEGEVKEDEPEQAATGELDEATKRSIDNSVQEYLSVKMVDEAKQTFEALPVRHRGELAKAFLAKGIDGKVDTVAAVIKLFKGISEAEIIPSEIFRDAFVPTMVDLEDIAGDAPKAFANAASFLKAAALTKEDVEYLQGQMVSNEDDLETIQNRLMEEYEKASP
jgi:translation initiation factor 4G